MRILRDSIEEPATVLFRKTEAVALTLRGVEVKALLSLYFFWQNWQRGKQKVTKTR